MMRREKVINPRGRAWVNGELDSETWFSEVEAKAREEARREIAKQLQRPRRFRPAT